MDCSPNDMHNPQGRQRPTGDGGGERLDALVADRVLAEVEQLQSPQ